MSSYYQYSKDVTNHAFELLSTLYGVRKDIQESAINTEKRLDDLSNKIDKFEDALDKINDHVKNTDNNVRQVLRNQNPNTVSLRNTTTVSDEETNTVVSRRPRRGNNTRTQGCCNCSICHRPGHNKRTCPNR